MAIDFDRIRREFEIRAEVALRNAAEFTLGRARHHAPVRAIFKRTRRGPAFTQKGPITTAQSMRRFRKSKERRRRVDIGSAPRGAEEAVEFGLAQQTGGVVRPGRTSPILDRGRPRQREQGSSRPTVYPNIGEGPRRLGKRTIFSGHANSLVPVLNDRGFRVTGDLRKLGPVSAGVRQHRRRPDPVEVVKSGNLERVRARNLSSRGRYEVKRATNRGLFQGRVGGRLRGEIRLTPVRKRGNVLWIYVESPTEYGPYQEFGTGRHRAQPFLRPALYESRRVLISEVNKIKQGTIITRGASSGVTPGQAGPGVD